MSTNQRTRLLVAAKDLVRALSQECQQEVDLLPVLAALQFELSCVSHEVQRHELVNQS